MHVYIINPNGSSNNLPCYPPVINLIMLSIGEPGTFKQLISRIFVHHIGNHNNTKLKYNYNTRNSQQHKQKSVASIHA